MKSSEAVALTELLQVWRQGEQGAASKLLSVVYRDLRRVAGKYMRGERPSHTLQATALVHEAWVRLSQSPNTPVASRDQFFRAMAAYMRRHLVDHARRKHAVKRGMAAEAIELDESIALLAGAAPEAGEDLEAELSRLDSALADLAEAHPRAAKVLELRFFGDQSVEQTAAALAIAPGTVKRDFALAKSFLIAHMPEPPGTPDRR